MADNFLTFQLGIGFLCPVMLFSQNSRTFFWHTSRIDYPISATLSHFCQPFSIVHTTQSVVYENGSCIQTSFSNDLQFSYLSTVDEDSSSN